MLIKENEIKLLKVALADNTSHLGTKRLAIPLFNEIISQIIDKAIYTHIKQKLKLKKKSETPAIDTSADQIFNDNNPLIRRHTKSHWAIEYYVELWDLPFDLIFTPIAAELKL